MRLCVLFEKSSVWPFAVVSQSEVHPYIFWPLVSQRPIDEEGKASPRQFAAPLNLPFPTPPPKNQPHFPPNRPIPPPNFQTSPPTTHQIIGPVAKSQKHVPISDDMTMHVLQIWPALSAVIPYAPALRPLPSSGTVQYVLHVILSIYLRTN